MPETQPYNMRPNQRRAVSEQDSRGARHKSCRKARLGMGIVRHTTTSPYLHQLCQVDACFFLELVEESEGTVLQLIL